MNNSKRSLTATLLFGISLLVPATGARAVILTATASDQERAEGYLLERCAQEFGVKEVSGGALVCEDVEYDCGPFDLFTCSGVKCTLDCAPKPQPK